MINQVLEHFKGVQTAPDTVEFSHCSADFELTDFVLTDGTIYQSIDGQLSAGGKKVRTLAAVIKFVALRA